MDTVTKLQYALAQRVLSVNPSLTLSITAKAKELKARGINVVSLSAGEPDFDTPEYIKQAAITALEKGDTKYTPASGILDLRKAIAAKLKRDQGLTFEPSQILVCMGAKHALFNVFFALLNPADEVLIPSPYWLSYPEMVTLSGGKSVFLKTNEEDHFKLRPEILRKALNARSKILVLNSPSNPTGSVYTREELLGLIRVLRDHPNVLILSDEIYEKLVFDGERHYSIATLDPEIAKRTVIVNGHSKAYAMTGWRLGYVACPDKKLAEAVDSIQSHTTSNPTSFAQPGGVIALEKGDDDAMKMCKIYERRRNLLFEKIQAIPKLKPILPKGAFYMFTNIRATGMDSLTFTESLLGEAHVAVVPGQPFGSNEHVRLTFAASETVLDEASRRIADWLSKK
ncbi:MAG: pyridoxal phosphate-dependent aminotransferase [Candidatus Omnitrophica bacterium]|nr:pyridoxal phosphate-dependent aminotransferase [Candidatus Omnitrophota bacterium]